MEELVARAATGDEAAWQALWSQLEPLLAAMIARPRFLGPIGRHEDDRRNIIVEVMARLRADHGRRLQRYVATRAQNPALSFEPWLRLVTKRAAIDYLRAHPDYIDRRRETEASAPGKLVEPGTLPPSGQFAGERPPFTNLSAAAQALRSVPDEQRRALEMWSHGASYDEIGRALGTSDAEKVVRAAVERLRRKFRNEEKP